MLELYLHHRNVLSLYFSLENITFNVKSLRNIDKHLSVLVNLKSVIAKQDKMYNQCDFVLYLNLQFWQVFDKIHSSEYKIQYLLRLDLFQIKQKDVEKKRNWCKNMLQQHFLLQNLTQQNIVPLKTWILYRTFRAFI